jgi:hypothetical protein
MKKLQHQLSTGSWSDVNEDRVSEFLDRCVESNSELLSISEATFAMKFGRILSVGSEWYSNCRMFDQQAHDNKMQSISTDDASIEADQEDGHLF